MSGVLQGMILKLFVAGHTIRSERAIAQARRICEHDAGVGCELVIVDVLDDPAQAEQARILATPTLIKESPPPVRRIIGDLGDIDRVMAALGLVSAAAGGPKAGER